MTHTFIDWNDQNAHAAAECAIRYMRDGYDYENAVVEAARMYSAPEYEVRHWFKRISAGDK